MQATVDADALHELKTTVHGVAQLLEDMSEGEQELESPTRDALSVLAGSLVAAIEKLDA